MPVEADAEQEALRALKERPRFSIRARIIISFILLFILMGAITATAVIILSEFKIKLQFVDRAESYVFEIQEARRHEKNFFLYGNNLSDALANIHTAHGILERSADEITSVVGVSRYRSMRESVVQYEALLGQMLNTGDVGNGKPHARFRRLEGQIRKHGAQIVSDAEEMIDRERLTMHTTLETSSLAAVAFLVLMLFVLAYVANFLIRSVLPPLSRFRRHAARVGAGDFSPITPRRKYRDEFSELAIAVNRMLSELKLRQDQLLQSGKMVAVGALTSGIAHELNNPLNNIGLTSEALLDGFDDYPDEEKQRMLRQINTQVERASSTVRNLLDFTRKDQPVLTSIHLPALVESTLELVSNEMSLAQVELEYEVAADLPKVHGNPRNLQQVFVNLMLNSIQAMPDGGTLTIRGAVEDERVRIDVQDTGQGIAPEHLDRIFDPFFTTKEPGLGTGLGLSVSYSIIEKHSGKITVASVVGEGTTFSVFLPIASERGTAPRGDDS